jgi:hypothetical protein
VHESFGLNSGLEDHRFTLLVEALPSLVFIVAPRVGHCALRLQPVLEAELVFLQLLLERVHGSRIPRGGDHRNERDDQRTSGRDPRRSDAGVDI